MISIAVSGQALQESRTDSFTPIDGNLIVNEGQKQDHATTEDVSFPNKYLYAEFAGWAGAALLDDILHKILSISLYRTWSIFDKKQAPGNDAFLSLSSVCKITGLQPRTVRRDMEEFQSRHLVELKLGKKLLPQRDGTMKLKVVIIKDFSGLYALAHDYLLWIESDEYLEADREYAPLFQQEIDPGLRARLLRYNNYRRIIDEQIPGRKPQINEHPYFAGFSISGELSQEDVIDAGQEIRSEIRPINSQNNTQNIAQFITEERLLLSDQTNLLNSSSSSNDSGRNIEERAAKDYTKPERVPETEQVRGTVPTSPTSTTKTSETKQSEPKETRGGGAASVNDQPAAAQCRKPKGQRRYEGDGKPRPVANPMISAFVAEFSRILGDGNPRGSETYLLRLAEEYGLSANGDVLECLIRAYVAASATKAKHFDHSTGQELKMPLFNTLFKTFAAARSEGNWHYTESHLQEDVATDERLRVFIFDFAEKLLQRQQQEIAQPQPTQEQEDQGSQPQPTQEQDQGRQIPLAAFAFEELNIDTPQVWMQQQAEAEALASQVEREAANLTEISVQSTLIHRCRSLRGSIIYVVEVEFAYEHQGQPFRHQDYYAGAEQWERYYHEQLHWQGV